MVVVVVTPGDPRDIFVSYTTRTRTPRGREPCFSSYYSWLEKRKCFGTYSSTAALAGVNAEMTHLRV